MKISMVKISIVEKQKHKKILLDWEDMQLIKTALAVLKDEADGYHRDYLLEKYGCELSYEDSPIKMIPKHLRRIAEEVSEDKIDDLVKRIFD